MSSFPGSPKLVRSGIVLMDIQTSTLRRVIPLQYNPDTLSRTLQPQGVGGEGGDRSEALRLKGPPVETIKLEAEIDATDLLQANDPIAAQYGIAPHLAALETIVYPTSDQLDQLNSRAGQGVFEIAPMETPLTLFIWSKSRIVPVRITEFSITEEAFDENLNPIRAKISLGMRVLSVMDLGFAHKGGSLYMTYQRKKEALAGLAPPRGISDLGIKTSDLGIGGGA